MTAVSTMSPEQTRLVLRVIDNISLISDEEGLYLEGKYEDFTAEPTENWEQFIGLLEFFGYQIPEDWEFHTSDLYLGSSDEIRPSLEAV